ncbi:DUF5789 family protein [Halobellus ruber]|uniref:DUF2795 domain-containing protein n=1 Tax=Halobellus ruber TaxID=2761102 RepID=A0A7J9SL60_9EURY|nr:hypothetical protein [Halobellus ruber]MBB6647252.1 hypothetical protein [Halobellus ruber]
METEIRLNRIDAVLEELDYPVTPPAVADACGDVVVRLAEGTVTVGDVVAESNAEEFDSSEDLEMEIMNLLPRDAVGEPFQSDGDA